METKLLRYLILGTLVWAILGSIVAAYYFVQYDMYQKEYRILADEFDSITFKANVLLNYGNGTKAWFNGTVLPVGSTAFNATVAIADTINYTDYGGELGILVTEINGFENNDDYGWFCWYWDSESQRWNLLDYSVAKFILHEGDIFAFVYSSWVVWPPPPPT